MVLVNKSFPQSIAIVWRVRMTIESHFSPIASKTNTKTFPSSLITERIDGYIEKHVFEIFQNFQIKVQNVRTGVLSFLTSGKRVNTRTENLRIHTTNSNTRTTSVGITTRSRWLEWHSHKCPKVTGTTSHSLFWKTKSKKSGTNLQLEPYRPLNQFYLLKPEPNIIKKNFTKIGMSISENSSSCHL
jgi:hypothetical protein